VFAFVIIGIVFIIVCLMFGAVVVTVDDFVVIHVVVCVVVFVVGCDIVYHGSIAVVVVVYGDVGNVVGVVIGGVGVYCGVDADVTVGMFVVR